MISSSIKSVILKHFKHPPTNGQSYLIDTLAAYVVDAVQDVVIVKGYAGTGKTSLIAAFIKAMDELNISTVLLAPTGRAAKVLSSYSGKPAYTIHKKIYRQRSSNDGFGRFELNINLLSHCFFIVDEASMISNNSFDYSAFGSGQLLNDLLTFVNNNKQCHLILVGDTAQLPPVGYSESPALSLDKIEQMGYRAKEIVLTEVVRQSQNSGILWNATLLRDLIDKNATGYPAISIKNKPDVIRLPGAELIETISSSYDKCGMDETIVINRSNIRANKYNQGIRQQILWRESEISIGDFLMVVKNNYYWLPKNEEIDFIANGDIVKISRIKGYKDLYGFRFADVTLSLVDYSLMEFDVKIILDTLTIDAPSLKEDDSRKLYDNVMADYADETQKKKRYQKVKENPYFNALQVKFAYAVTCHKAQGGQWRNVFIDQGMITEEKLTLDYLRWLYTAFTRASEKVYLVNFADDFFEKE